MTAAPRAAGLRAVGREAAPLPGHAALPRPRAGPARARGRSRCSSAACRSGRRSDSASGSSTARPRPIDLLDARRRRAARWSTSGALFAVHVALVIAGRRTDQLLLPTVGLLGGIGLLLMERLPQDLAGSLGGLAQTQLVWLLIGLRDHRGARASRSATTSGCAATSTRGRRSASGLLLLVFLFGTAT